MSGVQNIPVSEQDEGMRLDRWFRQYFPQIRHGMLEKFLRKGQVRLDGGRVKANARLTPGQMVRVPPLPIEDEPRESRPPASNASRAEDRQFLQKLVIFEDEALLVLNKPYGLAVQGGTKTRRHIDGMLNSWSNGDAHGDARPRLVHRLDRDTSGVLVLAKSRKVATRLGEFFQKHQIEKTYWALTAGVPQPKEGTIRLPIAKRMVNIADNEGIERVVPATGEDAKQAISDFQTLDMAAEEIGFLALRPRTGRTHQLRVHCAALGLPIVGDGKYGGEKAKIDGLSAKMHLVCRQMSFRHPLTQKPVSFTAPVEGHFRQSLKFFGFDAEQSTIWPEGLE